MASWLQSRVFSQSLLFLSALLCSLHYFQSKLVSLLPCLLLHLPRNSGITHLFEFNIYLPYCKFHDHKDSAQHCFLWYLLWGRP